MNYDKEVYEALARNYLPKEALKLADELENEWGQCDFENIADMIRKLVAELDLSNSKLDKVIPKLVKANGLIENLRIELDKQGEPVGWWNETRRIHWQDAVLETQEGDWNIPLYTAPQTKPLSDEEIEPIAEMMADMYNQISLKWKNSRGYSEQCDIMTMIYRAIEERILGK